MRNTEYILLKTIKHCPPFLYTQTFNNSGLNVEGVYIALFSPGTCWSVAAAQYYEPIESDNGIPWRGKYGDMDICHHDVNFTYTYALDFKVRRSG